MDNLYKFLYKKEKPVMFNVGGFIFLVFGLITCVSSSFIVGVLIVLLSILLILYNSGIEVDFDKRLYRETNNFGFVALGSWEKLPPLEYISVFKAKVVTVATRYATGGTVDPSDDVIQVNLITKNNRRIKIYESKDKAQAFEIAKKYAPILELDVWDATEKEGKWF